MGFGGPSKAEQAQMQQDEEQLKEQQQARRS